MKVTDIMQHQVDFVYLDTPVKEVARLIFGHGINGVPVCKDKKVVGFITERDILSKFYPTIAEFIEDPVHASNFEAMEKNASEILELKAKDIMSKHPIIIPADTPLLRAQSMMFVHKVGRLPVVDKKGELIGLVSKGDIFKAIVGGQMSLDGEERFYDWFAQYYDQSHDWERRLASEIPDLDSLFKTHAAKRALDVASGTGEHTIALAKQGYETTGVEASGLMHELSEKKKSHLPPKVKKRITFVKGLYDNALKNVNNKFDAALFLGNALPHVIETDKTILENVTKALRPKGGILVFQILNFDKILGRKQGFRDFVYFQNPGKNPHILFAFYNRKSEKELEYTRCAFARAGGKWHFRGVRSTPVCYITEKDMTSLLKDLGYTGITLYGGSFYGSLFDQKFKPMLSDWLVVVAKKE